MTPSPQGPNDVVSTVEAGEGATDPEYLALVWDCAGCHQIHVVQVGGVRVRASWRWNSSLTSPTLTPSILKYGHGPRCHSFVENGNVRFLSDCEHELAGKTVAMLPENARPFEE